MVPNSRAPIANGLQRAWTELRAESLKEPRILIVDDDPEVMSVISRLLDAHGLVTECFRSPAELLNNIAADDVGVVVTDLEMPGMTGIELQNSLLDSGSCLSVIVITGHADVPKTIEIMGRGAVTLLQKPFKGEQLIAGIKRAIKLSENHRLRHERIEKAKRLIHSLTLDELQVMKYAARGLPNKAISLELDISPRTVDRRRQSALSKLDGASVAEFAVLLATLEESEP